MDLLNAKATHIRFGTGIIKSNENGIIRIQFDEEFGEKEFLYPVAFEQFLKLKNPLLAESVRNELRHIPPEKERLNGPADRLKEAQESAKLAKAKLKLKAAKANAVKTAKKKASLQDAQL